jgi:hypothetical protein
MVDQRSGVVCKLLLGEQAVDVGGVPLALELNGNDSVPLGQSRNEIAQQSHS